MMYGYGSDMSWWMVVYAAVWFVLIAAAITAIGVWIRRSATPAVASGSARHILEERFARGEIDDEEFHRRLKVIQ